MKKTLLPIVIFVLTAGIVYGLTVNLFPDNSQFPRLPTGPGTIGGALSKLIGTTALDTYIGDGTVTNSAKLNGVTASGYLKTVTCALSSSVMVGIDADGESICGPKNKLLVGTWTEGMPAQKCPVDTGPCVPLSVGDTLYEGDIIKTTAASTGTITFADDLSILRLDTDTVVELQSGLNVGGETIAQAILNNGQLWGRIISNTGVNIGGGGVVAGVRGTSVSLVKSSTGQISTQIVDSVLPYGAATLTGNVMGMYNLYPGSNFTFMSGATVTTPAYAPIASIYTSSLWVRENTKKDLEYLYQKKNDIGVPAAKQLLASNEYNATLHTADIPALTGLCKDTLNTVFWPSLVGTPHEKCRENVLYAFADYTKGAPHHMLYSSNQIYDTISTGAISPVIGQGYSITATGQALIYTNTGFISSLAGKTITLKIGTNLAFGGNIFDGGNIQYKYIINSRCNPSSLIEIMRNKICKTITNTLGVTISDEYMPYTSGTTITLPITDFTNSPIVPERFILGAVKTFTSYVGPIKNTIQSITIQ